MFLEQLKLKPTPYSTPSLPVSLPEMECLQQTYLQKVLTWSYLNHIKKICYFGGFGLLGEWLIGFIL